MNGAAVKELLGCGLTSIVDVGAAAMDGPPPYAEMLKRQLCRVIGFEPQPKELDRLIAGKSNFEDYFPDAIGNSAIGTLRVCIAPGMTSMFEPDDVALAAFPGFEEWGKVLDHRKIGMMRLDDALGGGGADFIKIDAQGSELDILLSGPNTLAQAVAVQLEVSFVALYKGQPTFGAVDMYMRSNGFLPHRFAAVKNWCVSPVQTSAGSQLLEADIVYVRDFTKMAVMTVQQVTSLAMISHCIYGSFDLAARCVQEIERRMGQRGLLDRYMQIVRGEMTRG